MRHPLRKSNITKKNWHCLTFLGSSGICTLGMFTAGSWNQTAELTPASLGELHRASTSKHYQPLPSSSHTLPRLVISLAPAILFPFVVLLCQILKRNCHKTVKKPKKHQNNKTKHNKRHVSQAQVSSC